MSVEQASRCRRILVFGAKGGAGKTTIASNLLIAGAMSGLRCVAVDFDNQQSLWDWYEDRGKHAKTNNLVSVDVGRATLDDWSDVVAQTLPYELAVFDLPPGMSERVVGAVMAFAEHVDLVVMPSNMEAPTYKKLVGFMDAFRQSQIRAVFVLNKVIRGRLALRDARRDLAAHGIVCPIDVGQRDEVFRAFDQGLAVVEIGDAASASELQGVWSFVAKEIGFDV
jgi:chromosome partitioning protein